MGFAISLLRGINVGGHRKIRMADLRELYGRLGMRDTRTLLQSGNVVFETDESDLALVGSRLEAGIKDAYGFDAQVIMRSPAAFKSILQRHSFSDAQLGEASKVLIAFLSAAPSQEAVEALIDSNPGPEIIHADGQELYIFYTDGQARSKLNANRIERALGVIATARNWNTCNKVLKLLEDLESQGS